MILEIDLHGAENGLQEGKELLEVKLMGVKWIGLVALLAVENSIRRGNDRQSTRFKDPVQLAQMGFLATQMLDQLKTDDHIHAVAGQRQVMAIANHHLDILPGILLAGIANRFFRKVNGKDGAGLFRQDFRAIAYPGADVQDYFVLHQKLGKPVSAEVLVQQVGIDPSGDNSLAGKFHHHSNGPCSVGIGIIGAGKPQERGLLESPQAGHRSDVLQRWLNGPFPCRRGHRFSTLIH